MATMESVQLDNGEDIEEFDPRLEELWNRYGFRHRQPKNGSAAEKRLFGACMKYASYIDGGAFGTEKVDKQKIYEPERRRLHNEITIMVLGVQRTGMSKTDAEHISDFAYEYARGFKMGEIERAKSKEE